MIGKSIEREEDISLLKGDSRFADDMPYRKDTLHVAFVRSVYAHANIIKIDTNKAQEIKGVHAILTGEYVKIHSKPFVVGVKKPMEHWCIAVDKVRYVGEPVAIVIADNRYVAEDAAE